MRRIFLAAAGCVLAIGLSGCSEREFADDAAGDLGNVTTPWAADTAGDLADDGFDCGATEVATELAVDDLVGAWAYISSTANWNGDQAYAFTAGLLLLGADGRWDGDRQMGDSNSGVAYGPGHWSFDGRVLTLEYDDGSPTETYDGVLISNQVDETTGIEFQALTLEDVYEDGTGCTVHLLAGQP